MVGVDTSQVGFVYVLTNPSFSGMVKIGHTERLVDDRMNDLKTGVPYDYTAILRLPSQKPRAVEKQTHALLSEHRINDREFFSVSHEIACKATRQADRQINGIQSYDDRVHYITNGIRNYLPLTDRDYFFWMRFPELFADRPNILDIWQAPSTGDVLELHGAGRIEEVSGNSDLDPNATTDPAPFLDRKGVSPNGSPIGKERLISGDRLLWVTTDERGASCTARIFEVTDYCQVICRSWSPQFTNDGFPILMNDMPTSPPAAIAPAIREALALPPPRSLSLEVGDHPSAHEAGTAPPPPEHWIPQLKKPRRGRNHS